MTTWPSPSPAAITRSAKEQLGAGETESSTMRAQHLSTSPVITRRTSRPVSETDNAVSAVGTIRPTVSSSGRSSRKPGRDPYQWRIQTGTLSLLVVVDSWVLGEQCVCSATRRETSSGRKPTVCSIDAERGDQQAACLRTKAVRAR